MNGNLLRIRPRLVPLERRTVPTTFVVTTVADSGPGSLRQAIADANALPDADTVVFDAALTSGGDVTIGLTTYDHGVDSGEAGATAFVVTGPVAIEGPTGANGVTIRRAATAAFRLFHVLPVAELILRSLTVRDGFARGHGGGMGSVGTGGGSAGLGGAVLNQGVLTVVNSTLSGNQATGGNGGVGFASGGANYFGSGAGLGRGGYMGYAYFGPPSPAPGGEPNGGVFPSGNGGFGGGGAAGYGTPGGAGGFGGGGGCGPTGGPGGFGGGGGMGSGGTGGFGAVGNGGGGAGMGGAVFNLDGVVTIINSTLSGNTVVGGSTPYIPTAQGLGGAVFSRNGQVTIISSTLAGNTAKDGGGAVFAVGDAGAASVTLRNCILADTTDAAADFASAAINGGTRSFLGSGNLVENNAGGGSGFTGGIAQTADPALAALADNGGPTLTRRLNTGSVAIDAGDDSQIGGLTTDQRGPGFVRKSGSHVDIGAIELQPATPPAKVSTVTVNGGAVQRSRVTELKVTFDNAASLPANAAAAFRLERQSGGAIVTLAAGISGNTVTLTFTGGPVESGSLADGRYTVTALAAQIPNLDGNGDGTVGDDYVLIGDPAVAPRLFRLFGDADGDGDVDAQDYGAFRTTFGGTANLAFDFDNDGDVDAADFGQFRQWFGVMA